MDADGYLTITGRVKEMYKTTKGEYVAPAQIELKFAESSLIEQVCVVGNHLPQPIALVVLSEEGRQLDFPDLCAHLETTLTHINPSLKPYERVQRIVIMNEPWTVENDRMTPTLKLKRSVIEKAFGGYFEQWSEGKGAVIKGV
jgi:long-chain acyl-CoA synthetase